MTSYDFTVEGPVKGEIFVLWLDEGRLMLTGPCAAAPWLIEIDEGNDPVEVVTRLVRDNVGEPLVVHSTSWRTARAAVVLSFAAVVASDVGRATASIAVERAELARSQATAAPSAIESVQVLEHALRHLAWLVRDDAVVSEELGSSWTSALEPYAPEPFQNLR